MNRKKVISMFWLVFAILFFILAFHHLAESKQTIPDLEIEIPQTGNTVKIIGVDFEGFVRAFNGYVSNQNESNRETNLYAFWGYFIAGLTALFAMGLEWQEYISPLLAKLTRGLRR